MTEIEDHYTVFVRLPFNRGDFVDPPPVSWSAAKERALWDIISRQSKGNEIDWKLLSENFEVTQNFLLQQAAWLYERQLSQVRAQMKRVGSRQSATPSPAPGSTVGSIVGGQPMKRGGSGGSRVPSRIATQTVASPNIGVEGSIPSTPGKSKTSMTLRQGSNIQSVRGPSISSRPMSRQSSKDADNSTQTHSRRSSVQHQIARSPGHLQDSQSHSSNSEEGSNTMQTKPISKISNPSINPPRTIPSRSQQTAVPKSTPTQVKSEQESEDEDDSPSFLPFATSSGPTTQHDPSATLRGGLSSHPITRPSTGRRPPSEGVVSPVVGKPSTQATLTSSSTSSQSSNPTTAESSRTPTSVRKPHRQSQNQNPISPPFQTARTSTTATRRRNHGNGGSDTSPSMGSSFSDLDDTSVTQSALEEALLGGMGNTTATVGGVASRVSGISQALRSRYFDTRQQGPSQGNVPGQNEQR